MIFLSDVCACMYIDGYRLFDAGKVKIFVSFSKWILRTVVITRISPALSVTLNLFLGLSEVNPGQILNKSISG